MRVEGLPAGLGVLRRLVPREWVVNERVVVIAANQGGAGGLVEVGEQVFHSDLLIVLFKGAFEVQHTGHVPHATGPR